VPYIGGTATPTQTEAIKKATQLTDNTNSNCEETSTKSPNRSSSEQSQYSQKQSTGLLSIQQTGQQHLKNSQRP